MDYTAASPLELDVAARVFAGLGVSVTVGADGGVLEGAGAPYPRVLVGVSYEPALSDRDKDGIPDGFDRCPDVAEDFDRFQDDDGCPEPDNDNDAIIDINDAWPNDAEDGLVPRPHDGCPAGKTDQDGDGVADSLDTCPTEAEDDDGCPDGS